MAGETAAEVLFRGLVDDAGLFPPAALSMAAALARHSADRDGASPVLSHRFICPAERLSELSTHLEGEIDLLLLCPLDARLPAALDAVRADDRLRLAAVEGVISESEPPVETGVPVYAEVPVRGQWEPLLDKAASWGLSVKVRCGGTTAALFPTAAELGGLIHRCVARGLSFKATAGLHHALPYRDEATGFSHHGYLNLLLAAARAVGGASAAETAAAFEVAEAAQACAELQAIDLEQARATRALFSSYGSCSTSEPLEDLTTLGLLADGARAR